MQPLEHASNAELLSKLTGKAAAEALVQHYGGLTDLSKASFDELQHFKGIGQSKAAAIKSAFLLGQRLSREAYPESPVLDNPEKIAGFLREQNRAYTVESLQVVFLNTRRRMAAPAWPERSSAASPWTKSSCSPPPCFPEWLPGWSSRRPPFWELKYRAPPATRP